MVGFGIHTYFLSRIVLCLEVGLLLTLCYPPACVRHSPGGLPCTGRSFPLLLDSSFPALRHVSGVLPVVLTQGVVLYRSLLPLHLCCPQACVRYAPCGISPGGLPCTGRGQTPFPRFTFAPSIPNNLRSCFSYPDF